MNWFERVQLIAEVLKTASDSFLNDELHFWTRQTDAPEELASAALYLITYERRLRRGLKSGPLTDHDMRLIVDDPDFQVLPAAFVEFWQMLCLQNGQSCKAAYRDLVREFERGAEIPGYSTDEIPVRMGGPIPLGWSYRNLLRFRPTVPDLSEVAIATSAIRDPQSAIA